MMIGIIDYGMGNLKSVENALQFLGYKAEIISEREDFKKTNKLILPGVGAFADAALTIRKKEFDKEIKEAISDGKELLGICLGMQLLFEVSYENGEHEGLGILKGKIVKFDVDEKIPHIGWNSLNIKKDSRLLQNIPKEPYFYFVHSYHLETDEDIVTSTVFYGKEIQVTVEEKNIYGLQFHPEKSGDVGLKVLKNFGGTL